MKLVEKYSGILFDVLFEDSDKVCVFLSPSGTGKTFLFSVLTEYLKEKGVGSVLINSTLLGNLHNDIGTIKQICLDSDVKVVILDNADLYLTQDFLDALVSRGKTIIVSLKDESNLSFSNFGFYRVKYTGDSLNVRRKL